MRVVLNRLMRLSSASISDRERTQMVHYNAMKKPRTADRAGRIREDENRAWASSIEVDSRQQYLFETDKLQEMVGASAIMRGLADEACRLEQLDQNAAVHLFQPASGEVRAWSTDRTSLLRFVWKLREWLTRRGVEHTAVMMPCRQDHFACDRPDVATEEPDIQPDQATDLHPEPGFPDLAWVHRTLTALARRVKNAKPGSDARPVCSLFESCRIHGLDFANEWTPSEEEEQEGEGRERRRALRGYRARAKFDARQADRLRFVDEAVKEPLYDRSMALLDDGSITDEDDQSLRDWVCANLGPRTGRQPHERAITVGNLVLDPTGWFDEEPADQFVAFICADGDDMGRLLTRLSWNVPNWGNSNDGDGFGSLHPWERNRRFSTALDGVVRAAFRAAVAEVTLPNKAALKRLCDAARDAGRFVISVLPELLGGDDLWMIARKDVALPLCRIFAANVQRGIQENQESAILRRGIQLANERPGANVKLTMSQGVAFAKAGHPVHAMIEAAESLLDSAKTLRKGKAWQRGEPDEGCLDWHWIESSLSETVEEARAAGTAYVAPDTGDVMLLTTRPWKQTEAEQFERAAGLFRDRKSGVPRRKREQLDDILRRGHVLSLVAWELWWSRLRDGERNTVERASAALGEAWRLPRPGEKRAGREAGQWIHLPISPWIHLGKGSQGAEERHYYVTPLLDFLALDNLAGSSDLSAYHNGSHTATHAAGRAHA